MKVEKITIRTMKIIHEMIIIGIIMRTMKIIETIILITEIMKTTIEMKIPNKKYNTILE
jgi:hypothetical protein